jgi:hypothetical protein
MKNKSPGIDKEARKTRLTSAFFGKGRPVAHRPLEYKIQPFCLLPRIGQLPELDNDTPIRIVSQDSDGAQVEVTDGPEKGATGFVARDNIS